MMDSYASFVEAKSVTPAVSGITDASITDAAFPYQRDMIKWALRRGRSAIFADTGLGKTLMQLEWARIVSERHGPVLILTPLAVAEQTAREAVKWGIKAEVSRDGTVHPITITNYEMLSAFDAGTFSGVVIDESSILKNYTGSHRNAIIDAFKETPYKLACTATPAPNDHTELGNHAEFLGIKSRVEMLSEYFVHDGGSTQNWRVKGHAVDDYWRWVCTWAAVLRKPSDLGYSDESHNLPKLSINFHTISVGQEEAYAAGMLFAPDVVTLSDQRATRRATMAQRVEVASIIADCSEPVLIWCELNGEASALVEAIPGSVQVQGSDSVEDKVDKLLGFADGRYRVLITKPKIAGFGMNWQHCARVVFVGASHSYEQTYQAIRRCWRFGQKRPVDVTIIAAETEGAIIDNYNRKASDHDAMVDGMVAHMREMMASEIFGADREWNDYRPSIDLIVPVWIGEES